MANREKDKASSMKDYSENFLNLVEGQMTAREGHCGPLPKVYLKDKWLRGQ